MKPQPQEQKTDPPNPLGGDLPPTAGVELRFGHRQRHVSPTRKMKPALDTPRLCWTRNALVEATGLSYRTIVNLEQRGLLHRRLVGVNVAVYTDASVKTLFTGESAKKREVS